MSINPIDDEETELPRPTTTQHDPYGAWRVPEFRYFIVGNMLSMLGMTMQATAIGWDIYSRTSSAMALAWVGLVQVLPVIALVLPAGHLVDRLDRRRIIMVTLGCMILCSLGLGWLSYSHGDIRLMYVCLFLHGVASAFQQPARSAFLPQIIPKERFSNAVTWNSGGFQCS